MSIFKRSLPKFLIYRARFSAFRTPLVRLSLRFETWLVRCTSFLKVSLCTLVVSAHLKHVLWPCQAPGTTFLSYLSMTTTHGHSSLILNPAENCHSLGPFNTSGSIYGLRFDVLPVFAVDSYCASFPLLCWVSYWIRGGIHSDLNILGHMTNAYFTATLLFLNLFSHFDRCCDHSFWHGRLRRPVSGSDIHDRITTPRTEYFNQDSLVSVWSQMGRLAVSTKTTRKLLFCLGISAGSENCFLFDLPGTMFIWSKLQLYPKQLKTPQCSLPFSIYYILWPIHISLWNLPSSKIQ